MFGLSMTELMIILVVALVIIGPGQLPTMARSMGKALREVRRASDELKDTFEREVMKEPRPQLDKRSVPSRGTAALGQGGGANPSASGSSAAPPDPAAPNPWGGDPS